MSKNNHHGGKSGRDDHDDHGSGHKGNFQLLVGTNADNVLTGGSRNDLVIGLAGDDKLLGGAGNDILIGDGGTGGKHWGWNQCHWWKPKGQGNDYLDGGAGSDLVLAGKGDDVANYTLSENSRAHDVYDGGKGFDTLQLTLTHAELQLACVQKDIAAFEAFLACKADPHSDSGRTFHFQSFDLDARNFEDLNIVLLNAPPVAQNDAYALNEDSVLLVPGPGVATNDSDLEGSGLIVALVTGPAHGTLALGADGSFTYTPGENFNGNDSFTYKVNDGDLDSNIATVTLQVAPVNDAPVTLGDAATTNEDTPVIVNVLSNDSDVDGDTLSPIVVQGPTHGTLGLNGAGSFSYLPDANFHGSDSFTYKVNDGVLDSNVATVALSVTAVNDAPVAVGDAATTNEDTPVVVNVLSNDSDVDGDTLSPIIVQGPTHGTLGLNGDGSFSYLPNANFYGNDSFTYKVNDGVLDSNVATVTLQVAPVNDAPVAMGDAATTNEDTPVVVNVLSNDSDVDGDTLSPIVVQGPTHGTLGLNGDGSFNYLPNANFYGNDSFTYKVNDSALDSNVATVALSVTAVNDAPAASGDAFTTDEDVVLTGNVLANDTDVDGDALSAMLFQGPNHGTLILNVDGSFSYAPNANFYGTDSFTYRASDGQIQSGTAEVTLGVAPVNDAPVAVDDTIGGSGTGGGPIMVAVIGGSGSTYVAAAAQLNDETNAAFDLDADAIAVTAWTTEAQWATALANYDVVVLGGSGGGNDYGDSPVFAALRDFVDAGGGVVTTGWFMQALSGVPAPAYADADYITPMTGDQYAWANNLAPITFLDPTHPIAGGVSSYAVAALLHELAPLKDGGATALATGTASTGDTLTAIAYDEVGAGLTVYLGSLHFASAAYLPDLIRSGDADLIFERAVAWAAGPPASGAATDEDTILVIDDAQLLANDTDIEGDALSIVSVAATSTLGASITIDAAGNVVYNPTVGLQYLSAGQIETDTFEYTVGDGHGGFDTAKVSLTVAGINDAPDAVNDARSTSEDTAISSNVLGNDSDPEGNTLTVTSAGTFNSTRGAAVTLGADGGFSYDPSGSAELQALTAGASAVDSFSYTISDGKGGTDNATVSITVAGRDEPGSGSASGKLLDSVSPDAQLDYYIRVGDATEWLRLDHFGMGLSNSGSLGGSGGGAGKVTASDLYSVLGSSSTILELTEALATGAHIKDVEIEAYRAGGDKGDLLVDQYYFDTVFVTGLQTGASAFSTANNLSFEFARFNHGHVDYNDKGGVAGTNEAGWDFVQNKSFDGGPSVSPDAFKGKLDDAALPTDADLHYYVTFDGAPGWLELHSFSMGLANSVSLGGGGAGAGKASASDVGLLLGSSAQILELTDGVTEGAHFKFFEVEAYREGGDKPQLVDQYYFKDVLVTGLNTNDANANFVSLDYGAFSHGHIEQDIKGGVGPTTETGWDFVSNEAFSHAVGSDFDGKLLDSVSPDAQLDYYIRVGDATEWLRLDHFGMGLSNSGSLGGSGGGAGKVTASDLYSVLGSSSTILELTEALATGAHIKDVEIEAYRAGGDKGDLLVDQYYFDTVFVTGLQTGASAFSTANNLSFEFARFNHGHVDYNDKGGVAGTNEAGWDFVQNKSFDGGPSVSPDAFKGKLDDAALPTDADLHYYVTFDGAPGWLELHSFSMGLANSVSLGGGGAGAGKASASDVGLLLGSSAQILELTDGVTEGAHFKFFEVEAYREGGDKPQLVDQYYFKDVLVTGLNTNDANANFVSLDYGAFSHGHIEQDIKGGVGPTTETGWDFVSNEAFSHAVGSDFDGKLLDSVSPDAQLDYYIRVGDATEWLRLDHFGMGLSNSGSLGGSGGGAGKVTASDLYSVLGSSSTILELTEALATGAHIKDVEIEAYRAGGDKGDLLVDQYYFDTVFVTGLQTGASAFSTANNLSFEFARFNHGHVDYNDKGGVAGTNEAGWDFVQNKSFDGGPSVSPDAFKGKLDDAALPTDADLHYYVTFDGAPGWLELHSFSMGLANSVSLGGGGAGAGKASASDVGLLLGSSAQILELTDGVTEGAHFKFFEVEAYREGGDKPQLVDQYYFKDVLVTGLNTNDANANFVSLDYGAFSHGHIEQDIKGGVGPTTETGWDFVSNEAFSHPVAPDVDLF